MNSIRFAVIVLGVVPALLVLTVQGFPVEQSRSRLYRDTESMAAEGNSTVARPVLGGIETLERFQVAQLRYINDSIPYMKASYHTIINTVSVLVSASYFLDFYNESGSEKLTVLSVIIEEVILDICQWLSTFPNTALNCTDRETIVYESCQWLSTFFINDLDCENREELLATFVVLGLNLNAVDEPSLFGVASEGLPNATYWIDNTEPVLEHQEYLCAFPPVCS